MMRCIAIDDEPLALDLLEDNIRHIPYLQLTAKCTNALEAIAILQNGPVDLLFLDIQMPGLTGLQFIRSLADRPMVILITAYEKYALDGFELDVIDYLVKPVAADRFLKACNKALELYHLREKDKETGSAVHPEYLFVNVEYSLLKINTPDIVWIEGLKDYIRIHLKEPLKPVVTRMNLKDLEEQLPPSRFLRIHKSYILSIQYITAVRKSSVFIGAMELPVGDVYRDRIAALTGRPDP
jgi:two-component system LytT family response regulator